MPRLRLVKFTANWCEPCRAIELAIKAALAERPGVSFEKVDVDTSKGNKLADEHRVSGVPTLMIFRGEERVWRSTGVIGKRAIVNAIDRES